MNKDCWIGPTVDRISCLVSLTFMSFTCRNYYYHLRFWPGVHDGFYDVCSAKATKLNAWADRREDEFSENTCLRDVGSVTHTVTATKRDEYSQYNSVETRLRSVAVRCFNAIV
jgi:hypothetical protein